MSARPRPSFVRSTAAKLAVAGAAGLASVLVVAPMAVADDVPTSDPGETPAPTETAPDPATAPTPTEQAPAGVNQAPSAKIAAADGEGEENAAEDEEVEPNFGLQKFRVGVKVADGSHLPDGQTTAGSTFSITITSPDNDPQTITCATDESTLDPEVSKTATYCLNNQLSRAAKLAANPEVNPDDDLFAPDQVFLLFPGQTATITQTTSVHGLIKSTNVHTIEPCVVADPENDYACEGNGDNGSLQTEVLYSNALPSSDPEPPAAESDDAVLPDTGGADPRLFALSMLMIAGGGWLTAKGRRPERVDAGVS